MLVKITYTSGTHNKRNEKVIEISDKKSVAFCIIRVCISKLTFRSINKNIRKIKRNISNTIGRGVYFIRLYNAFIRNCFNDKAIKVLHGEVRFPNARQGHVNLVRMIYIIKTI